MKVVAVIPAYNEGGAVGDVVKGCLKHCGRVIVVDDSSEDGTCRAAKGAGALVFRNERNMGVGYTVRRCYQEALKLKPKPDIIVNLDGDGQHDPDEIPDLIRPIVRGEAGFVLGSRTLGRNEEPSLIRKAGNLYFSFLISLITRRRITDSQSGYRAITLEALKGLEFRENYTNRQEMIIVAAKKGLRIREVPVHVRKRPHGSSFIGTFREKFYFLWKVSFIILKAMLR